MLQSLLHRAGKAGVAVSMPRFPGSSKKKPHKALSVDLILREILSYLSPQELRRVKLVCKRWSKMCGQFGWSSKKWNSNMGYSPECAKGLAHSHILQCEFNKYLKSTVDPKEWLRFWQVVSQTRKQGQLRQVEFIGEVDPSTHVIPILREISWVTTLCINANTARKLDIHAVLVSLPQLRHLDISGAVMIKPSDEAVLPLTQLTHLGLDKCYLTNPLLEELLDSCPRLGYLRLTGVYHVSTGRSQSSMMDALSLVKRRCPTINPVLDEVFLEANYMYDILRVLPEMPKVLPRATKFRYRVHAQSYWKTYTTISVEYLTRLEIRGKYWLSDFPVEVLHNYLCHDDARHLRELVMLDVWYPEEYLDPSLAKKEKFSTWSSRNLVVLQMGFGREDVIRNGRADDPEQRAQCTRRMVGFIVSMCPRLTDLWIRCKMLDFSLDGGMCYLTRLERLQTLKIQMVDVPEVTEHDLVWLAERRKSTSLSIFSALSVRRRGVQRGKITSDSIRMMENVCRKIEKSFATLQTAVHQTEDDSISDGSSHEQYPVSSEQQQGAEDKGEELNKELQRERSHESRFYLAQLQSLTVEYNSEAYYFNQHKESETREPMVSIVKRIRPRLEAQVYYHTWIERQYNHP
ncbi:hypothetical protein BGW42_008152 [Actinomortierella wolfii]|nr:hypothetical protein BGW42_008152 [Actinomortierella wolfii]